MEEIAKNVQEEAELVRLYDEKRTALHMGRRTMEIGVQGRRKRGTSMRRWLDRVTGDINEKGLSGEAYDRAT